MTLFEQQFKKYKPALQQGVRIDVLRSFFPSNAHFCYFMTQLKSHYSVSECLGTITVFRRKKITTLYNAPSTAIKHFVKINVYSRNQGLKTFNSVKEAAGFYNVVADSLSRAKNEKRCMKSQSGFLFPYEEFDNYSAEEIEQKIQKAESNAVKKFSQINIFAVNLHGEKIQNFASIQAAANGLGVSKSTISKYLKNKTPINYQNQTIILTH